MNRIAVALVAVAASITVSGAAVAGEFSQNLVFPSQSPRAEAQVSQQQVRRPALDYTATKSVLPVKKPADASHKAADRATNDVKGGIAVDPWIVPSFH